MAKVKSPNYPQTDLGTALTMVREAYQKDNRNKMSPAALAKHLGHMSLSGPALSKIGVLRAYGLVEGAGDELRISEDAVTALMGPEGSPERASALTRLSERPKLFQDIRKNFPSSPSPENLKFWLIKRKYHGDAAEIAAKSYLATMRLVGGESESYNPVEESENQEMQPDNRHTVPNDSLGHLGPMPDHLTRPVQEKFILDEGEATLVFPQRLSVASCQDLEDRLALVLRGAKRRAEARERLRGLANMEIYEPTRDDGDEKIPPMGNMEKVGGVWQPKRSK